MSIAFRPGEKSVPLSPVLLRKKAILDRWSPDTGTNRMPHSPMYLTISEVGDHRQFEDIWIAEPDANLGFDVYNLSGVSYISA